MCHSCDSSPPSSGPAAACPAGSTGACPKTGGVKWEKQPGATDEDLRKAQQMWEDAKKRRLPDGSKPDTVKAMERIEASDKTTTIQVGPNGNTTDWGAGGTDPTKGSDSTIQFDPNKAGTMSDGTQRDPESSLAHEAYHADEANRGVVGTDQEAFETRAAAAENQQRVAKGLPQRQRYGSWPIPQYTPPAE
jgi:hypothetical protein